MYETVSSISQVTVIMPEKNANMISTDMNRPGSVITDRNSLTVNTTLWLDFENFKIIPYIVNTLYCLDDGDEDVVVCNNLGPPQLYENKGGNTNNWIKVNVVHKLVSTKQHKIVSFVVALE